jgi:hypothetical protein
MSDSDPSPDAAGSGRGGFWTFWATLPGILTGGAALLTAIVGLMTLLKGSAVERSDPDAEVAAPAPTASASGSPASPPVSASAGVFTQGQLTMKSPDSADLEQGLVGSSPPGYDLYLHCSGIECILNAMSSLMTVADGATDRSSCVEALRARRDQALYLRELNEGQGLCVQTADGHVGHLRLLQLPGVGSIEFVFSYTLWR